MSLIDEHRRPPRAHGPSRLPRLAQGQRRLGAAHRADATDRLPRPAPRSIPTASSTRPTASPSAAGCIEANPGLTRAARRRRSATRMLDDPDVLARLAPLADDAAFREQLAAVRRANKVRAGRADPRAARGQGRSATRCSTCRSSASTNTSASCSTSSRRSRSTTPSAPSRRATGSARQDLRRQGGGELSPGQADHQAGQRRGAGRSTPTRRCATC